MKFVKIFPKFQEHVLLMATSTLPQNLQEAAVTICSKKFGCLSQESLPKFKEHLFLMTAFKVYHMQKTWGGLFKNWLFQCMGDYGGKYSLEKGKGGVWREGLLRKRKISS